MSFKLLIDECLSPALVAMAHAAGHLESTCVRDRGWLGVKDWVLIENVVNEDFTLVTHNSKDFRGTKGSAPGGLHNDQAIHAGLICLNVEADGGMDLGLQEQLFAIALQEIGLMTDLVNQALEVTLGPDGTAAVDLYEIPTAP